jgi:O-antigen/teichoic acid export membrane protein
VTAQPSILSRFGVSLAGNLLRSALAVVSGLVVARSLGPADYGGFVFLLSTLTVARQLLDLGTSSAFFTFVSRRPRGPRFFRVYAAWQFAQIALLLLLVGALLPESAIQRIWLDNERGVILLACAATLLQQQVWTAATQLGESRRLSRQVQVLGVAVAVAHLVFVTGLARFGWMSPAVLFSLIAMEYAVAAPLLIAWIGNPADPGVGEPDWRAIAGEYWRYCRPLAINAWVGVAYGFADSWLLQRFGGPTEQGYFAASNQLAQVTLLATASLLQIFWKEMAECHHGQDMARAWRMFDRSLRILLLISAATCCFLLPWSREIIGLLLGEDYLTSWPVFALMLVFPVHTALGQIVVAMYSATGRTQAQALIFNAAMVLSIPTTYIILADPRIDLPGLGLGSIGLAGKLVVIQVIQVNVLWWWICRSLGWRYEWAVQLILPAICLGVSLGVHLPTRWLWSQGSDLTLWLPLLASLAAYFAIIAVIVSRKPGLVGLEEEEFRNLGNRFRRLLFRPLQEWF